MGSVADLIRLAAARRSRSGLAEALRAWAGAAPALRFLEVQIAGVPFVQVGEVALGTAPLQEGEVVVFAAGGPPGTAEAVLALVGTLGGDESPAYRQTLHDLRGALAVVLGQSEMLAEGVRGPLPAAAVPAVAALRRQAERAADLTDSLMRGESDAALAQRDGSR